MRLNRRNAWFQHFQRARLLTAHVPRATKDGELPTAVLRAHAGENLLKVGPRSGWIVLQLQILEADAYDASQTVRFEKVHRTLQRKDLVCDQPLSQSNAERAFRHPEVLHLPPVPSKSAFAV